MKLRKRAQERHWKLNEYGLFSGENRLAGKTEESVYHRLNLPWIPPELREDTGEVEAADNDELPNLIEHKDLRGDLHCHTNATDGKNSIAEMAQAAVDRGYDYLAITDHSKAVAVTGGLNNKDILKHRDAIHEENAKHKDFWLLAGVEVDILKSGQLDLKQDVLAELDWVVASIHSYMKLDEQEMTNRLLAAIKSGVVHCLGHPTVRIIGKREPITFDYDTVFEACREHNVCVEINSEPDRLDLPDYLCRAARDAGVLVCIETDAHHDGGLDFIRFGVNVARRGWLEKKHVLNTRTRRQLEKHLA